jgi:arylamine N-acetyltransferase
MPRERRHVEWFGPDLARGPVLSGSPPVAAVQIATALAQLRVPLSRADSEIEDHAEFIRSLADKLFPDYAADIRMDVGDESANTIDTLIRVESSTYSLLHCWLADSKGGGETTTAPTGVTWKSGTIVQTVTANKQYVIVTPTTGVVSVSVAYSGDRTWYWAAARHGRVYYSSALDFNM